MQRDQAGAMGIGTPRSPLDVDRLAVGSRRRALDRLWTAFREGLSGPVLITGEPGAGKSWLADRFAERLPAGWRSAGVEMTSALDGPEMLRLIGDELGLEMPDRLGAARLRLGAGLRDADADGRGWLLIVDEVHRAAPAAWEEIQALSNRLGRSGGFAAMILLGRTELARELATDRRRGWANRLGLHVHLPPLDLDEARELLRLEGRITGPELETLHRDTLGNPRAMLRVAAAWGRPARPAAPDPADPGRRLPAPRGPRPVANLAPPMLRDEEAPDDELAEPVDDLPPPRLPSLIPARPPIRLEEGLVEVGWEGDLEAEPTRAEFPPAEPEPEIVPPIDQAERNEELVEDRYAALQAWAEWSRNRERPVTAAADPAGVGIASAEGDDLEPHPAGTSADETETGPVPASIRAEPPHEFAPYSQLFSRLRHSS